MFNNKNMAKEKFFWSSEIMGCFVATKKMLYTY